MNTWTCWWCAIILTGMLTLLLPSNVVYNPEISQIALLACFQYYSAGATYWLCTLFISLFTGFFRVSLQISVIDFNHFLFCGIFIWFFRGVSQAIVSEFVHNFFSQGFSEVFFRQSSQTLIIGFFTGFFTGLFQSQVFSQGTKSWNFLKI